MNKTIFKRVGSRVVQEVMVSGIMLVLSGTVRYATKKFYQKKTDEELKRALPDS